ncbi:pyruvate ferredoxin/flavodoxin oxidoreductase, beta subunit [Caldithrix abyssi DSM 13497]|uniref:2-oxoglutarate ferredoxin oxidoreductase subunit beta n=1 Tax=Caldithrix abyssi DSM 13497 TaxID=880073 RepID=H1XRH8_CALAY|nr:2-oxoacid:ferredoxin oxidoreductase subunit beta [Caldithrix abyssi]APF18453.1 2-oxoglutarate ferredoxin oxidoreductase subunit beta [Caldithrix abyssi DSM 13497]EHO42459.1 pyruvate ferredoxin/flavodoxin oxidoreductase, beta subunit [Caldithrix abyssi DSM 13497]
MNNQDRVATQPLKLTAADFASKSEPRWCPGCGDYAIYAQMKKILPELGIPKEKFVFVSGIGCSSRFPYYMNTFGVHSIHGRAPTVASGIKLANPELKVFIITGDGDGLSIGGNHFIHLCRRNIDVTVILFNNRIYGLTKGQYSPTSVKGQITKSSPYGTLENPFNPVLMAMASGATFVARTIDRNPKHLAEILRRAAEHKGTSFVEVYQNCVIFNDGAFEDLYSKDTKDDRALYMEKGKPYIFGKNHDKVLKWNCSRFEAVPYDEANPPENLLIHDEKNLSAEIEFGLASLTDNPDLPTPMGIFRQVETETYEELLQKQIDFVKEKKGEGDLETLFNSGNTFIIE